MRNLQQHSKFVRDQMTERRAIDVAYGHLGEASYDVDERLWSFSRQAALVFSIQPLYPLEQCFAPAIVVRPESPKKLLHVEHAQKKWLSHALPEVGSAATLALSISREERKARGDPPASTLLAIGKASDIESKSGKQAFQIMAMADGEAGNILRLIKPRAETLGWDGRSGTKLKSINPVSSEYSYWKGDGGAIRHLAFGADGNGSTSWLAVLKNESTTILRPLYRRTQTSSTSINLGTSYPPSCLDANPILTLSNETTGARAHADVSFNPWYARQFAVVDQQGYWSVWNIEGHKKKRNTCEAIPGRSGHVYDEMTLDDSFANHDADGWGQIMWAGNVTTLVVCDRRTLSVFDLKTTPKRLHSPEIVRPNTTEWIIDVQRNPKHLDQIFVLTTMRLVWLRISDTDTNFEEEDGDFGAQIILSCRHFRNDEEETSKIALLGENGGCMVLLYSIQSPVINTYRFSLGLEGPATPVVSQGSFQLLTFPNIQGETSGVIQTLCLLPASFVLHNLHSLSGLARDYASRKIDFYQMFSLSVTLGLSHTLCATKRTVSKESSTQMNNDQIVIAPTVKGTYQQNARSSRRVIEYQFVVPDGFDESDDEIVTPNTNTHTLAEQTLLRHRASTYVDAHTLFEVSFLNGKAESHTEITSISKSRTLTEHVQNAYRGLYIRKQNGPPGITTFVDLLGYTSLAQDIDEAASTFQEFLSTVGQEDELQGSMAFSLYEIRPSPFGEHHTAHHTKRSISDLSNVYDELVDLWISHLPQEVPGPTRLARERMIHNLAMELYMSSLAILMRDRKITVPKPVEVEHESELVLPVRAKEDRIETLNNQSSQASMIEPLSNQPTPAATPSLQSDESTSERFSEDQAISRLRSYALSIKQQPPLGATRSAILSHWPSARGADPRKYSWDAARTTSATDREIDSDEKTFRQKREKDRRRRRTEKFLRNEQSDPVDAASQRMSATVLGSQPEIANHMVSSQNVQISMTQPDRGVFGSRPGPKIPKRGRTKGF